MKSMLKKLLVLLVSFQTAMMASIAYAQSGTGGGAYEADLQGYWNNPGTGVKALILAITWACP